MFFYKDTPLVRISRNLPSVKGMKWYIVIFYVLFSSLTGMSQTDDLLSPAMECSSSKIRNHQKIQRSTIKQSPLLNQYDVSFYHLNLQVEDTTTYLSGNVIIKARTMVSSMNTFVFELIDEMIIDSILVNGLKQSFIHTADEVFVSLSTTPAFHEMIEVNVFYHGLPPAGGFFTGVNIDTNEIWNTPVVWTLSEPFNARQWFPVKQVLDDKADSVWVFLTTSSGNKAGSIGLLTNEALLPGNKIRYEWKSSYPIAYYLISYSVAHYQDYSIYAKPENLPGDSLLIQNYIYDAPGCLDHFKAGIDRTVDFMELFSNLYGLYPFYKEKYGHCLAEIKGGMEHQTMTTLNDFGYIVAHELAHMWFGDNVTCATWSDIWVNEGFATYSDYLAHEKIAGPYWSHHWLDLALNFIISEPDGSVYIPADEITPDNVSRIFSSRLSYYKGAYLLHMIRFDLNNDDLFFQAFKNYQEKYADSVATGIDFLNVLNETTGEDFTPFFQQWYFGEGFPLYDISWSLENGVFTYNSLQSASMPEITPFFDQTYPVKLYFDGGNDTTLNIHHTTQDVNLNFGFTHSLDSVRIDPDFWMLKKIASINGINSVATKSKITVSPNPAGSYILISTDFNGPFVTEIMDLTGKKWSSVNSSDHSVKINVADLKTGVYLITVSRPGKKYLVKFIKH